MVSKLEHFDLTNVPDSSNEHILVKSTSVQPLQLSGFIDDPGFCQFTGYKRNYAAQLRHYGRISYHRVGRKIFYKISDVIDFVEAGRIPGNAEIAANAVYAQQHKGRLSSQIAKSSFSINK